MTMLGPLKTFIIYSQEDRDYKTGLEKFLRHLVRRGKIVLWSDREIKPGEYWDETIQLNLSEAEVILMLVSVDFYNSDYIQDTEFTKAKEKLDLGEALLIPILVRYCPWKSYDLIKDLQCLPTGARSVDVWTSQDQAFTDVAEKIEQLVEELLERKLKKLEQQRVEEEERLQQEKESIERKNAELQQHDEAAWETVLEEIEKTTNLPEKIELFESYLHNKDFVIYRETAEKELGKIKAKIQAGQRLAEAKELTRRKRAFDQKYKEALEYEKKEDFSKAIILFEESAQLHETGFEITKEEIHQKIADCKKAEEQLQGLPDMVFVKGGTFMMGSNEDEREKPIHSVTLSDYYIGKYPVTQRLWKEIMGNNPSHFKGNDDCPVETVSWIDVQLFLEKLNQRFPGKTYRLPTEAEWEFAARGGTLSKGFQYAGSNNLEEVGWYSSNTEKKTHPVGQKKPNELGIYDMSGNVWEWCGDWFENYDSVPRLNPMGPSTGDTRVCRGGSCVDTAQNCRSACRGNCGPAYRDNFLGFRLVLSPQSDG